MDLTTTIIAPGGKLSLETWRADRNAPVDCFYVYPTVSTDPAPNSDMIADEAERNVIRPSEAYIYSNSSTSTPKFQPEAIGRDEHWLSG